MKTKLKVGDCLICDRRTPIEGTSYVLEPGDIIQLSQLNEFNAKYELLIRVMSNRVPEMTRNNWIVKKNHFRKLTRAELILWQLRLPNLK